MARVSLNNLCATKTVDTKTITINDTELKIVQYLPIADKATMLGKMTGDILDSNGLMSPIRKDIYFTLYLLQYYTNFNITETMLNNAGKTYDLIILNHILEAVEQAIPPEELNYVKAALDKTLEVLIAYRTSAAGILDYVKESQQTELQDIDAVNQQVEALSQNEFLQEILKKMG